MDCKIGAILRKVKDSTCSGCYAMKGNYRFPSVMAAHERRLKALSGPDFVNAFIFVLQTALKKAKGRDVQYFRWHDSGDLQDEEHFDKICEIARGTPEIKHWLPTREYAIVRNYKKPIPDNLVVRFSAPMIGQLPKWEQPFSTVGLPPTEGVWQCPAPKQEGVCGACRKCWDPETKVINYAKH